MLNFMRKIGIGVLIALTLGLSGASAAQRQFFGIATGGTGGTYYPLGGMLAQLLSNNVALPNGAKLSATAETGNASVANSKLLGRNGIESAFIAADILDSAYHGKGQFKGKAIKNLRALGSLYPETVQLVTLYKSNIRKFSDLKGQSVSSGSPGSGQWQLLGDLLKSNNMTRKNVKEDYSSFSQSVEKLKDGNLTASLITAGMPTSSVTELANGHKIRIVPLTGQYVKKLLKLQPAYAPLTIPAGTYKGQTKPVKTLAVRAIWATNAKLSDDVAYAITKALYENTATLAKVHPKGKEIALKTALESVSIPLHPGAAKYYREKGLLK